MLCKEFRFSLTGVYYGVYYKELGSAVYVDLKGSPKGGTVILTGVYYGGGLL
jgi:hypothetical protein